MTTPAANPALGDIFMTPADGPVQAGAMIVNPAGQMVWFAPAPSGLQDADLRVQSYLGHSVLTYWQGRIVLGHGVNGIGVIDNPDYRQVAAVKAGNGLSMDLHDFDLEPNGVALITVYEPVYVNLRAYGGLGNGIIEDCIVQEIDVRTGPGHVRMARLRPRAAVHAYSTVRDHERRDLGLVPSSTRSTSSPTGTC